MSYELAILYQRCIHIDTILQNICQSFESQIMDHSDLLFDMICRSRHIFKFIKSELFAIIMKYIFIFFRDFSSGDSLAVSSFFHLVLSYITIIAEMSYICDIDDMSDIVSADVPEYIFDQIIQKIFSHISDVRMWVYRHSAWVDSYFSWY